MLTDLVNRQEEQKSYVVNRFKKIFLNNPSKTDGYAPFLTDIFDAESENTEILYSCEFPIFPRVFLKDCKIDTLFNLNAKSARGSLPTNKKGSSIMCR